MTHLSQRANDARPGARDMHPFDLREALLAKHAQHVVLVHFPIALFITGVAFDFFALRWKGLQFAAVAYYNIVAAALSTPFVIATGLLAWKIQLEGEKLKGALLLHLLFGGAAAGMIWLVCYLHFRARQPAVKALPLYRICIELLAVIVVALAGHLGGFVSGVNGPG
jgi:uncharacterized membrane protein